MSDLPPGSGDLDETPAFLENGFEFVESRARRHGPVFRTRILGRDTAVIVGPDACAVWIDPSLVKREGSQPGFIFEILAGPSLPHLDGDGHRERKSLIMEGFTREALAGYLPDLVRIVESADGISRILAAALPDGTKIAPDALTRELHHIIIAGYIIFAEFAWAAQELSRRPDLRLRLEAEIREQASGGLSREALDRMPLLSRVVMEVKRLCPILPVIFGVARRTFEFKGCSVPEGWAVFWALRSTHLDRSIYSGPETFDPERFAPGRAEHMKHAHAFVPQGPGPDTGHKCPGTDYATYFMKAFIAALLRGGTTWEFTDPVASYNWRQIPPEPMSGLRARFGRSNGVTGNG